jgi:hypothetical protein
LPGQATTAGLGAAWEVSFSRPAAPRTITLIRVTGSRGTPVEA